MKLFIALALAAASATAMAQTTTPQQKTTTQSSASQTGKATSTASAEERGAIYSKQLKKELNLTDDQYNKVLAVNTECIRRKDAAKSSGDKEATKSIKAYRNQQFQTILMPDQMTKLKSINAQGGKGGKNGKMNADSTDAGQ